MFYFFPFFPTSQSYNLLPPPTVCVVVDNTGRGRGYAGGNDSSILLLVTTSFSYIILFVIESSFLPSSLFYFFPPWFSSLPFYIALVLLHERFNLSLVQKKSFEERKSYFWTRWDWTVQAPSPRLRLPLSISTFELLYKSLIRGLQWVWRSFARGQGGMVVGKQY